jgi:two-component system cell cycle sensor histidine kinase/response regulator CckA
MNFVVNARDAMPNGGEFHLTTERCQIDARAAMQLNIEEGEYIRLIVRDTGTGMTREVQEKVFEPFFTTKGDRGNGFGLATTYGIVKQCRGGITFQSELGVGTTFTLYFPVTEDKVDLRPIQDTPAAPLSSGPRTVMVVEDEREVRIFACLLLQTAGFKVLEAESGIQALKLAQTHRGPIDLLFTDVVLGDISGSKMAEKFKLLFPATPVLFTSGYANDEIALHGVMQDRIAFIAKPYSPATLLARIRTLFEQGTPVT